MKYNCMLYGCIALKPVWRRFLSALPCATIERFWRQKDVFILFVALRERQFCSTKNKQLMRLESSSRHHSHFFHENQKLLKSFEIHSMELKRGCVDPCLSRYFVSVVVLRLLNENGADEHLDLLLAITYCRLALNNETGSFRKFIYSCNFWPSWKKSR